MSEQQIRKYQQLLVSQLAPGFVQKIVGSRKGKGKGKERKDGDMEMEMRKDGGFNGKFGDDRVKMENSDSINGKEI